MREKKPIITIPRVTYFVALVTIGALSVGAYAGHSTPVPEPSMLSLLGMGSAIGILVYVRNKRK